MNNSPKKIGVIGLGPVGVHLQEAGCDVAICDIDKVKINLIRKEGVRLEGVIDKHTYFQHIYTAVTDLKELDPEILVFSVKAHQMQPVVKEAVALNNDKLCVVSAQNGIDVEQLLGEAFGESKTLRMVINYAGNLNTPNVVKVTFFNPPNYIASIDDSRTKLAEQVAEWLNGVELQTKVVDSFEILKRVWVKTILNAALSPLCGIGKLTMREAMDIPDTVEIIEQIILEGIEVAETEKIKFEDDFVRKCLRYLRKAGNHFPSLAVDLINNRPTEIDYMNGKIVDYGRKHYIRTPLNLAFANMVKAITLRDMMAFLPAGSASQGQAVGSPGTPQSKKEAALYKNGDCFLGIDLGSVYTKFTVIDEQGQVVYQTLLKTLNRDRVASKHVLQTLHSDFNIRYSCATGYGRKHFADAEIIKTEINCAAVGGSQYFPGAKTIIDIGGEDIKVIRCNDEGNVENFYLNDKCAAGTGAFITEISERAELEITEMNNLAAKSHFNKELNSFCTVFAKTEIMGWLFNGVAKEDIAKGIYLSIANRVSKLRVDLTVSLFMIGGVIAYHPYLKDLLEEKFQQKVQIIEKPIYITSYGAALIAKKYSQMNAHKIAE
jgi:2-dehydropantoate 2-reductase